MISLKFTPNPRWAAWAANQHTQRALTYLQDQPDKTFSITLGNQTYALYYVMDGDRATIYSRTGDSIVLSSLQLNVGHWLLPVAESLALDDQPGLNPEVSQELCREIYEGSLPPQVGQAIMAKIQETGLFQIILNKNNTR